MCSHAPPQSILLPGAKKKRGEGIPRIKAGETGRPKAHSKFGPLNLYELFDQAAAKYGPLPCMGKRRVGSDGKLGEFEYINYDSVLTQLRTVGSGLRSLGLSPGSTVGIWASNRIEWMLSSLGAFSQAITNVPLYDTLGEEAIIYEINHAELTLIVLEKAKLNVLAPLLGRCPTLKTVVQIEPLAGAVPPAEFEKANVAVTDWANLTASGLAYPMPPTLPSPESNAFIMYTSGTTGNPKVLTPPRPTLEPLPHPHPITPTRPHPIPPPTL